ncbi:MAG: alkylphosphonate utilization protein [Alphaproteobacteria bacterium]|nr:alkylphosphonate utilization protein [Alphaproteobacteria bacterium]
MTDEDAKAMAETDWGVAADSWQGQDAGGQNAPTLDANGTALSNGDTVTLIKDLPVKGAGVTLKRGTLIKNISLTSDPAEIDCRTKEVKGLVLKSCFVKKG